MGLIHQEDIMSAILKACPDVERVFLFGSRARRDYKNPHCDIDIGIMGKNRLSSLELSRIDDELDKIDTLYTIEVVDFSKRDDEFSKEALRDIELLYEKG
ncbi:MAG: nucleotidyltransferase domain-containing protein [bacterium]